MQFVGNEAATGFGNVQCFVYEIFTDGRALHVTNLVFVRVDESCVVFEIALVGCEYRVFAFRRKRLEFHVAIDCIPAAETEWMLARAVKIRTRERRERGFMWQWRRWIELMSRITGCCPGVARNDRRESGADNTFAASKHASVPLVGLLDSLSFLHEVGLIKFRSGRFQYSS